MSERDAIPNNTVIIRAAGSREIISHATDDQPRRRCGARGGHSRHADLHDIERLLDAGCPLQLAWAIMRPFDEPVTVIDADADADR